MSRINKFISIILLAILLVGCAKSAPAQPKPQPQNSSEQVDIGQGTATDAEVSVAEDSAAGDTDGDEVDPIEQRQTIADSVSGVCEIHFIDIGQGDCTLIKCGGEAMLIDSGTYDNGTKVQLYLQKEGVKELKYCIATHPDADHIGSMGVVITKFPIETFMMPNVSKDTKAYEYMVAAIKNKGITPINPTIGNTYELGDASFTILNPGLREYEDINDYSIAIMLKFGLEKVLLIGDCEEASEQMMLNGDISLDADIYKAGHHGSSTSSNREFLERVSPVATVISCGVDNDYGHPHAETLNTLRELKSDIYRTDEQGTVIAELTGAGHSFNMAPSESWSSGENVNYEVDYEGYWNTDDDLGMFH